MSTPNALKIQFQLPLKVEWDIQTQPHREQVMAHSSNSQTYRFKFKIQTDQKYFTIQKMNLQRKHLGLEDTTSLSLHLRVTNKTNLGLKLHHC